MTLISNIGAFLTALVLAAGLWVFDIEPMIGVLLGVVLITIGLVLKKC